MRLLTYNVNGLRAAIAKGWLDWLRQSEADILCLQEVKAARHQLPERLLEEAGYRCYWHSAQKKGYSGVAILCKTKPEEIRYGCGHKEYDDEGRFLCIRMRGLNIVSVYLPSGSSGDARQAFKMKCLPYFDQYVASLLNDDYPHLLLGGDFNICHKAMDIHDPVRNKNSSGFLPEERQWLDQCMTKHQLIDTFRHQHPHPHHYSWWSFRSQAKARNLGWRIDYWLASKALKPRITQSLILSELNYSDHCPVLLKLQS